MAVTRVAVAFSDANSASSKTATIATTPAAGDYVLATYSCVNANTVTAVSGMGATWGTPVGISAASITTWYVLGTGATTSGTVTATLSTTRNGSMTVQLIRGVPSGATLTHDTVASSAGTGITGPSQSAGADSFVCASMGVGGAITTFPDVQTPSGAYTSETAIVGAFHSLKLAYATPASTASYSVTGVAGNFVDKRISQVVLAGGGSTAVSLTGALATMTLGAPTGTINIPSPLSLTGQLSTVTLSAPAGTVAAGSPTSLTGALAIMALGTYNGTVTVTPASGSVALTGALSTMTLGAPVGSVAAGGGVAVALTGALSTLTLGAPVGSFTLAVASTASVGLSFGLDATSGTIHARSRAEVGLSFGMSVFMAREWDVDPRTGRPQYRYVVADRTGQTFGELVKISADPITDGLNEIGGFKFTIGTYDPAHALLKPVDREVQVYRGRNLLAKGPILPRTEPDGSSTVTYECQDPRWYFSEGRRVIAQIPKRNLLKNGDFLDGLSWWSGSYDPNTIPAAAPLVSVVDDEYAPGGKALQVKGADKSQLITNEVKTAAVFAPNSATYLSGGEDKIRAVGASIPDNSTVHIVGYTADDGTGNGLSLSLARAQAARSTLAAQNSTLTFTLPSNLKTPNVNDGQVAGRGFYEQIGSTLEENRRVVISYVGLQSATGSSQYEVQTLTVTQPVAARVALTMELYGLLRITEWIGPNLYGYAAYLRVVRISDGVVVDESDVKMDANTPRDRWWATDQLEGGNPKVSVPNDGQAHRVEVRFYAPNGTIRWTRCRLYPEDGLRFFDTDQALIVKGIVDHAQDTSMGWASLNIGTRTALTGVKRDKREYVFYMQRPTDVALQEFTALDRGLDIDMEVTPDSATLVTHYPRQGTTTQVVLEHGGNVMRYAPATSRDVASLVIAQADGSGVARPEEYAIDDAAFGGMRLATIVSAENETPVNELDELAALSLRRAKVTTPAYWLDCHPRFTSDLLDRLGKGDVCRLIIRDGYTDVDGLARLVKRELDPNTDSLRLLMALED